MKSKSKNRFLFFKCILRSLFSGRFFNSLQIEFCARENETFVGQKKEQNLTKIVKIKLFLLPYLVAKKKIKNFFSRTKNNTKRAKKTTNFSCSVNQICFHQLKDTQC